MRIREVIPRDEYGLPLYRRTSTHEAEVKHNANGDPAIGVPDDLDLLANEVSASGPLRSSLEILMQYGGVLLSVCPEQARSLVDAVCKYKTASSKTRSESRQFDSDLAPAPLACVADCSHSL
jgi:hypothetical protein